MNSSFFRWFGWLLSGGFVALMAWANWQEPDLHAYTAPITTVILQVDGVQSAGHALELEQRLSAEPGVSACSVRPQPGVAALVYNPALTTVPALIGACTRAGLTRAIAMPRAQPLAANAAQCPVPTGYVVALDRLRFALNLRRLWISV